MGKSDGDWSAESGSRPGFVGLDETWQDMQADVYFGDPVDRSHEPVVEALIKVLGDRPIVGAELGVHRGQLSRHLLTAFPKMTLHMVDTWSVYEKDPVHPKRQVPTSSLRSKDYLRAIDSVDFAGDRAKIHRSTTVEASGLFSEGSLDFVFIDASHDAINLTTDLNLWLPLVRHGGLFFGHDYGRGNSPEVKPTIDRWMRDRGLVFSTMPGTVWVHWKGMCA